MRDAWEWTEVDLQTLVNEQVQESLTLEYKQCDALGMTDRRRLEVSKDVSAMANSAGGTLVYGIVEAKHVPTSLDDGFDPHSISKEWLEQVINSTIHRRIPDIRINAVQLSNGRLAYVVCIPQSTSAPHMAGDKRFYKRFNFQSVPMEEYEVRDVGRRLVAPDLFVDLQVTPTNPGSPPHPRGDEQPAIRVQMLLGNKSPVPANFAYICVYFDRRSRLTCHDSHDNAIDFDSTEIPVCSHELEWRGSSRLPIWSTAIWKMDETCVLVPKELNSFLVFWEAHAPMMPRRCGVYEWNPTTCELESVAVKDDWKLKRQVYRKV